MIRKNYILLSLAIAAGVYLYEVLSNLLSKVPFLQALTEVDWGRIVFIGLFAGIASSWLLSRSKS